MGKSTEAEKRAAKKYSQSVDRAGVIFPKGTKEKIMGIGEDGVSQYVNRLVEKDLKHRHRDVVKAARSRIKRDIGSCNTVDEWHAAFHALLNDFREEVEGEEKLEKYIESTLGAPALSFFLKNVTIARFSEDTIRHMEAVDDFFDSRDIPWLGTDPTMDKKTREHIKKMNSPEFMAMEDYKYLSHLYAAAVVRAEQLEANIVNFLGQEAFDRLLAQGDYDKDRLYYAAMASTHNKAKQSKYLFDWLTKQGMFAPDDEDEQKGIEDEGWILPSNPPAKTQTVQLLLADGASRVGIYFPPEVAKHNGKSAWVSCHIDYSALVIGYQPLGEDSAKEPVVEDSPVAEVDADVEAAWKFAAEDIGIALEDNEQSRELIGEQISKDLLNAVMEVVEADFPPSQKDLMIVGVVIAAACEIVKVIGSSGYSSLGSIHRVAMLHYEKLDDMGPLAISDCAFEALKKAKFILVEDDENVRLNVKGIVHYDYICHGAPFRKSYIDEPWRIAKRLPIMQTEEFLRSKGYDLSNKLESRFIGSADVFVTKNGQSWAIECMNFDGISEHRDAEFFENMLRRMKPLFDNGIPTIVLFCGKRATEVWDRFGVPASIDDKPLSDLVMVFPFASFKYELDKNSDFLPDYCDFLANHRAQKK